MKHLIYSDVHMKPENLQWCSVLFDEITKAAHEEGVIESGGYLVNGGDLFNERGVIRTSVFDLLAATRRKWAEMQVKHIDNVGNHDQEDRDGEMHPLRIFDTLPGSQVIEKPTVIEGVRWHFFPYSHRLESQMFDVSHGLRPHAVAFVHAGIKDAFRNDKSRDTDGLQLGVFKGWKRVFSGHYHFRHEIGNVQYIGSPMQHSFAEAGQDKGFLIFDDKTNTVSFREVKGTPKHHRMALSWPDGKPSINSVDADRIEVADIDNVQVTARGSSERVRAVSRDSLAKMITCAKIKIERVSTDATVSRIALDEKDHGDVRTLMSKYVDHLEPSLDKARLLDIGAELLGL